MFRCQIDTRSQRRQNPGLGAQRRGIVYFSSKENLFPVASRSQAAADDSWVTGTDRTCVPAKEMSLMANGRTSSAANER